MSDADNQKKNAPLTLKAPSTLSLTKTVESGKVKQNFQRGRSKTVTVEVKKTRTFARGNEAGMVEVQKGASEATKQRQLNQAEREARLRALQQAEKQEESSAYDTVRPALSFDDLSEDSIQGATSTAIPLDDVASRNLAALRNAPSNKPTVRPDLPGALKRPSGSIAPRVVEDEAADRNKKARAAPDTEYKRGGKLTITQALGMDDQIRMRSLASVKRQRAKVAKKSGLNPSSQQEKFVREVIIPEAISVQELANRMAVRTVEVIKELMKLGTIATPQQAIDADTAELLCGVFGHNFKRVSESDVEEHLVQETDADAVLISRPPVVTIMGHVDHGKTSLLDALRQTDVVSGEAGGITQHIGAYQVQVNPGQKVTFLDTPGHEAFTAMRARGAKVTDIVVLVVAADDGIMPQTIEAIHHAKAANVPIIVAINKIDKPGADITRVKTALMSHELVLEEFGGEVMAIEVSAKEKRNLDKLLASILVQAEVMDLKANPNRRASGAVVESRIDRGRGVVATLLVQGGTLKTGDIVVAGSAYGRARAIHDDRGNALAEAGPSLPIEILGLDQSPEAGDEFSVAENEKAARDIVEYRRDKEKKRLAVATAKSLDQLFTAAGKDAIKELAVIVKSDVHGSAEAIVASLAKFDGDEVKVKVIHNAVGAITESDVGLAQTTGAIIIGFNVRAMPKAKELAAAQKIDIRYYSIIYNLIDDIKAALSGMLTPEMREDFIGYAEIREVFNITKVGKVAGCMVTDGLVKRGAKVRLLRDNVVIHEGSLKTLKRFKDEVKEVKSGFECGMAFEHYDDIRAGDMIECFEVQSIARSVEAKAATPVA
jgi:translation initiation factor IF-2